MALGAVGGASVTTLLFLSFCVIVILVRSWRKKAWRAAAGMGDTGTEGADTVMRSISQVSDLGVSPSSIPPVHLPEGGPLDCSAQHGPGGSHVPRPVPHLAHSTTAPPSFRPSTEESPSLCPPFLLLFVNGCHVLCILLLRTASIGPPLSILTPIIAQASGSLPGAPHLPASHLCCPTQSDYLKPSLSSSSAFENLFATIAYSRGWQTFYKWPDSI